MMIERLARMLDMQHDLQVTTFGIDPMALEPEERAEYIRWNVLALEDELHEALRSTGWKPWGSSRHINAEEFLAELVDAFHFFMNLLLVAGGVIDGIEDADQLAQEVMRAYMHKHKINADRQVAGYDGVS